jgi:hypothetical protein
MEIDTVEKLLEEMKAIRTHLENLFSAHIVNMHKKFNKEDVNIVFNSLINLATQLIEFNNVSRQGHVGLDIRFDRRFDGFINLIRNDINSIKGIGAVTIYDV